MPYVPSMQAIAETSDVGTILGAQIVGGVVAIIVGFTIKKIRILFPPIITGTVGLRSARLYGSWKNWVAALFTLIVVTGLNHFAKGF